MAKFAIHTDFGRRIIVAAPDPDTARRLAKLQGPQAIDGAKMPGERIVKVKRWKEEG